MSGSSGEEEDQPLLLSIDELLLSFKTVFIPCDAAVSVGCAERQRAAWFTRGWPLPSQCVPTIPAACCAFSHTQRTPVPCISCLRMRWWALLRSSEECRRLGGRLGVGDGDVGEVDVRLLLARIQPSFTPWCSL